MTLALIPLVLCSLLGLSRAMMAPVPVDRGPRSVEIRLSFRTANQSRFSVLTDGDSVRSGDEIKVELQASEEIFAYVFHRGSSGEWTLLFPNPERSLDPTVENPLKPGQICPVPGETSRLVVDRQVGEEAILVCAMPEPDLVVEQLVSRLRKGERVRILLSEPPASTLPPGPPVRREQDAEDWETGHLLLALRDLTFAPAGGNGAVRLPARSAFLFRLRHLDSVDTRPGGQL